MAVPMKRCDQRAEAESVKAVLGAGKLTPVLALDGADVELVLGRDFDRPGGALGPTGGAETPTTQLISRVVPAQEDPIPPTTGGAVAVPPPPC